MCELYSRIEQLCHDKGVNITVMCKESGANRGTLTDLKMGRRSGVNAVTAQKIASYFGVTVGYLLGSEEKEKSSPAEPELNEGEKALIELFRHIPEEQQKVFLEMGRVYADSLKKDRT